jgi:nitrogen fixation/metabolism regulation signal transduction histidine kinase
MNIEEIDDKKERSKKVVEGTKQLEFMSQTIDDFRDFYVPKKEKERFSLEDETKHVLELMHFEDIEVKLICKEDAEIFNYKNEFRQVLLNLLSNAKEALLSSSIKKPFIIIEIDKTTLRVADNAGGIKAKNLQKIFEPYFTTKEKSSGIGLYMSKMIVEKNLGGSLTVENKNSGAVFKIEIV